MLARKTDINNPKGTETFILNLNCEAKYKNSLLSLYQHFCKANQIKWEKPKKISENASPIMIPTEERINVIISSATPKYAVVYNLSKYGLRPDEISKITLRDLDLDRGELTVRTSKLGLERTLQLKRETVDMLKEHTAKCGITELNQRLFSNADKITEHWAKFRRIAYEKFKDPELLKIRLYDLRHWYATMTYLKSYRFIRSCTSHGYGYDFQHIHCDSNGLRRRIGHLDSRGL